MGAPFTKGMKFPKMSANALNLSHDRMSRPRLDRQAMPNPAPTGPSGNHIICGLNYAADNLEPGDVVKVKWLVSDPELVLSHRCYEFGEPDLEGGGGSDPHDPHSGEEDTPFPTYPLAVIRTGGAYEEMTIASVYGCDVAWVDIVDVNHRFATVVNGGVKLVSADTGPFMLIPSPQITGMQRWPVYFPMSKPGSGTDGGDDGGGEDPGGEVTVNSYSIGVVTGAGASANTIKYRGVIGFDVDANTVTLSAYEWDATVWPTNLGAT